MNWKNILTVYLKELKDSLRDRRAILSIVIIPTLVMPALFFGVGKIAAGVVSKAKQEIPSIMIIGGGDSPEWSKISGFLKKCGWLNWWKTGNNRFLTRKCAPS